MIYLFFYFIYILFYLFKFYLYVFFLFIYFLLESLIGRLNFLYFQTFLHVGEQRAETPELL
jgi:hypothetical protein